MKLSNFIRKNWASIALWCVVIVLAIFIAAHFFGASGNYLEVVFIDVGQGDGAFIRTSSGVRAVIDAGGDWRGGNNVGRDIVGSYLIRRGIFSLDKAFVSHFHADHGRGVAELAEVIQFDRLFLPNVDYDNQLHRDLVAAANRIDADIYYISRGHIVHLDDYTYFEILWPIGGGAAYHSGITFFRGNPVNHNDDSLVMRLVYGNTTFLFTGDIEERAEVALLNEPRMSADILQVAHHGSRSSSGDEILDLISPRYAIVSAGLNNQFGHPHASVVNSLNRVGTTIYRTDWQGTVTFSVDRNGIVSIRTTR